MWADRSNQVMWCPQQPSAINLICIRAQTQWVLRKYFLCLHDVIANRMLIVVTFYHDLCRFIIAKLSLSLMCIFLHICICFYLNLLRFDLTMRVQLQSGVAFLMSCDPTYNCIMKFEIDIYYLRCCCILGWRIFFIF